MILSEKLILLRKEMELSQEQLAEQLNVSRQAVSKWESGASIPDLDKIIKMSQLFGVSVDYLVKDDAAETHSAASEERDSNVRVVSMEEADLYMATTERASRRIAAGVVMCILSPVLLILLAGMAEFRIIAISEDMSGVIGVAVLLGMIAAAVATFIMNGMALEKYSFLEHDPILCAYGVSGVVAKKKADYEHTFHTHIAIGVTLCVISVIPVIISAALDNEFYAICAVCVLLALVSMGVYLFIQSGMIWSSYAALLQEGDYSPEHKQQEKKIAPLASIYWCTVTAGYLAVSFYCNNWDRSWIVWPVAGVLFAAVSGVYIMVSKNK